MPDQKDEVLVGNKVKPPLGIKIISISFFLISLYFLYGFTLGFSELNIQEAIDNNPALGLTANFINKLQIIGFIQFIITTILVIFLWKRANWARISMISCLSLVMILSSPMAIYGIFFPEDLLFTLSLVIPLFSSIYIIYYLAFNKKVRLYFNSEKVSILKIPDQKIVEYIKGQLGVGVSHEMIRNSLISSGWPVGDVDKAFLSLNTDIKKVKKVKTWVLIPTLPIVFLFLIGMILPSDEQNVNTTPDSKVSFDCKKAIPTDSYSKPLMREDYSNTEPMYGSLNYEDYIANRTEYTRDIDEKFLFCVTKGIATKKAFEDIINTAEYYRNKKDLDMAMKRYNQAWLIDHENYNVYWGYGMILGMKYDFEKSAEYFDLALSQYSTSTKIFENDDVAMYFSASMTYINLASSYFKKDDEKNNLYSTKVINLLSKALDKSDSFSEEIISNGINDLIVAYYYIGDYAKARKKYQELSDKYPQKVQTELMIGLDKELKDKGY